MSRVWQVRATRLTVAAAAAEQARTAACCERSSLPSHAQQPAMHSNQPCTPTSALIWRSGSGVLRTDSSKSVATAWKYLA